MDFKPGTGHRRHVPRHHYIRTDRAAPAQPAPPAPINPQPVTTVPAPVEIDVPATTFAAIRPAAPIPSPQLGVSSNYISNPFLSTIKGLVINLEHNPTATLVSGLIGLAGTGVLYGITAGISVATGSGLAVLIGGVLIAAWLNICIAVFYCISALSINQEELNVDAYFKRAAKKFFPFLALAIISFFLACVGIILFIAPGVYFIGRSALAPLIMFTEDLGPIASLKRSFKLTKGHVNEVLGSVFAGIFIGESYYSLLFGAISVSPIVGRYVDLVELERSRMEKPKIHPLNFLYLIALFFTIAILAVVVLISIVAGNQDEVLHTGFYLNTKTNSYQTSITPGNPTIPQ
jgi:hypothetical protein